MSFSKIFHDKLLFSTIVVIIFKKCSTSISSLPDFLEYFLKDGLNDYVHKKNRYAFMPYLLTFQINNVTKT